MPSTKFQFSCIGMEEVLKSLTSISTAHNEFTQKYIQNETLITQTVRTQINQRITAYDQLSAKLSTLSELSGRNSISKLKKNLDEETRILKEHADKKLAQENDSQKKMRENQVRMYGGVGPSGGFGGIMATGIAGMGIAVGTAIISEIASAMKQGFSTALEFGKDQLQQHFAGNDIMSSIIATRQPGSNISREFLSNTALAESNRTGVHRADMLTSMKVFQKAGGEISAEAAKNLATEHMLDPSQDITQQAQGLAGFYKADPSNYYQHYIAAKAAASFGGLSIEESQQSIIKLAELESARGMNKGNKSATIDESSRLIQIMSYGGLSAPQAETGIHRFLIDRDKANKLHGQSIQQTLQEADQEMDWKSDNRELQYQIEELKKEPGKAALAAYHEAVMDLQNENVQHLIHNDYNPKQWQKENVDEISKDSMHQAQVAIEEIVNAIYVLASPTIYKAAEYITNHKDAIEQVFVNLENMFEGFVNMYMKDPDVARTNIKYIAEEQIFGVVSAWWNSSYMMDKLNSEVSKVTNPTTTATTASKSHPHNLPQISNINSQTQTTSVINAGVIIDGSKSVR